MTLVERTWAMKRMTKVVSLAGSLALVAGAVASVPAQAARGDQRTFSTVELGIPNEIIETATSGLNGSIYIIARDDNTGAQSYHVLSPSGNILRSARLAQQNDLRGSAVTADGIFYVCLEVSGTILRIDQDNNQSVIDTGLIGDCDNPVRGVDGNVWFSGNSNPATEEAVIGKITSAGQVTTYGTRIVNRDPNNPNRLSPYVRALAPGSAGSGRMYFVLDDGTFQVTENVYLGTVSTDGAVSTSRLPNDDLLVTSMVVIDDRAIMFDEAAKTLTWLADPQTLTSVNVGTQLYDLQRGSSSEFWAGREDNKSLSSFTKDGTATSTVPTGGLSFIPNVFTVDPSGNLWVPQRQNGITRILSGLVPTVVTSPTITPETGVVPGTALTARPGTWRYDPDDFSFAWQRCETSDASTCTNIQGAATTSQYTTLSADDGKYVRVGITAYNLNGASEVAYSSLLRVGATAEPEKTTPPPPPTLSVGKTATIGNGVVMELDAPTRQKRGKRAWYEAFFSATDTAGTVTFTIKKGARTVTKTVNVVDGTAEYRWKAPKRWRKGRTTVTATYVPASGSPYSSAAVLSRVRIR